MWSPLFIHSTHCTTKIKMPSVYSKSRRRVSMSVCAEVHTRWCVHWKYERCGFITAFNPLICDWGEERVKRKRLSSLDPTPPLLRSWQRDSSPASTSQLPQYGISPSAWVTVALPSSQNQCIRLIRAHQHQLMWTEKIKNKRLHRLKSGPSVTAPPPQNDRKVHFRWLSACCFSSWSLCVVSPIVPKPVVPISL